MVLEGGVREELGAEEEVELQLSAFGWKRKRFNHNLPFIGCRKVVVQHKHASMHELDALLIEKPRHLDILL